MFVNWLIAAALVMAVYCLLIFAYQAAVCIKNRLSDAGLPRVSLVFMIRNQQEIIEGLIRKALDTGCASRTEVIAVNVGSCDETGLILERLARNYNLKYFSVGREIKTAEEACQFCSSSRVFCLDMTGAVDYRLMEKTIESSIHGANVNLNRTKVL